MMNEAIHSLVDTLNQAYLYFDLRAGKRPAARRNDAGVMRSCRTRAAAQATLERAEIVVDSLVADIKSRLARIHHVTIEVEGIATPPLTAGTLPLQAPVTERQISGNRIKARPYRATGLSFHVR